MQALEIHLETSSTAKSAPLAARRNNDLDSHLDTRSASPSVQCSTLNGHSPHAWGDSENSITASERISSVNTGCYRQCFRDDFGLEVGLLILVQCTVDHRP